MGVLLVQNVAEGTEGEDSGIGHAGIVWAAVSVLILTTAVAAGCGVVGCGWLWI